MKIQRDIFLLWINQDQNKGVTYSWRNLTYKQSKGMNQGAACVEHQNDISRYAEYMKMYFACLPAY